MLVALLHCSYALSLVDMPSATLKSCAISSEIFGLLRVIFSAFLQLFCRNPNQLIGSTTKKELDQKLSICTRRPMKVSSKSPLHLTHVSANCCTIKSGYVIFGIYNLLSLFNLEYWLEHRCNFLFLCMETNTYISIVQIKGASCMRFNITYFQIPYTIRDIFW